MTARSIVLERVFGDGLRTARRVSRYPRDAPIVTGETVALVTRQLGAWVLAGCRLMEVVDEPETIRYLDGPDRWTRDRN